MPIAAAYMVPHPPMIIPRIGNGSEEQVRKTTEAYEAVAAEIAEIRPETIIVTSPHATLYADYFHISPGEKAAGDFGQFRAPDVRFREEYDTGLVKAICALADAQGFPAGTLGSVTGAWTTERWCPCIILNRSIRISGWSGPGFRASRLRIITPSGRFFSRRWNRPGGRRY